MRYDNKIFFVNIVEFMTFLNIYQNKNKVLSLIVYRNISTILVAIVFLKKKKQILEIYIHKSTINK
jgi:hypothetical protein